MRNLGLFFLFILWCLFGWKLYSDQKACCDMATTRSVEESVSDDSDLSCADDAICFDRDSYQPLTGSSFKSRLDSLAGLISDTRHLKILGLYNADEKNSSSFENLGLARADAVSRLFSFSEGESGIELIGQQVVGAELSRDDRVRFEWMDVAPEGSEQADEERPEVRSTAVVYFAFNSTEKLSGAEIEAYLDQVASRVKSSGENVSLTGHTDNIGEEATNMQLGRMRAQAIMDYLLSKGLSKSKIRLNSRGEELPVASNDTEEGRARNRRVELIITN